jgi:hypothetical protein
MAIYQKWDEFVSRCRLQVRSLGADWYLGMSKDLHLL